jgi:hypothetical protein
MMRGVWQTGVAPVRIGVWQTGLPPVRASIAVLLVLAVPSTVAAQVTFSSEIQSAWYPREGTARAATDADVRGWSSLESRRPLVHGLEFRGDLTVYGSNRRRAVIDGEAALVWRRPSLEIAAGLLREQWGRFPNSSVDAIGPANTAFSLVDPMRRLSQPTVRTTIFLDGLALDLYALAGRRGQPVPESDGRFGFAAASRDVAPRAAMGDHAVAARLSASTLSVDWSAHVFAGRSRRPTFVPRLSTLAAVEGIDAVYNQIVQAGGEVETTRAEWRLLGEGLVRSGGVDMFGRRRVYGEMSAAAEYQRLGAFGGAYNLIPRFEIVADTRGDAADIPFASSWRGGARVATTQRLPLQVDIAYSRDWAFGGHGLIASAEKGLGEAPTMSLGFRVTSFSGSRKPSVLDVWKDDVELYTYLRIEVSR